MIRLDIVVRFPDGRTVRVNDTADTDADLMDAVERACRILHVRIERGETDTEAEA